jgi:hypothetical protein
MLRENPEADTRTRRNRNQNRGCQPWAGVKPIEKQDRERHCQCRHDEQSAYCEHGCDVVGESPRGNDCDEQEEHVKHPTRIRRQNIAWLIAALTISSGLAACASNSDGTKSSGSQSNRYFGDHPGQEATKLTISNGDCRVLRLAVEGAEDAPVHAESEASPPSSHCLISGRGLQVSVYLDASTAARQRYFNRMTEQVQFYGTQPAKRPHAVAGVGDRGAHNQSASWIPALSTLYAVRGNRWLTVSYAVPGVSRAVREDRAAELARQAFALTAR